MAVISAALAETAVTAVARSGVCAAIAEPLRHPVDLPSDRSRVHADPVAFAWTDVVGLSWRLAEASARLVTTRGLAAEAATLGFSARVPL